MTIDDVINQFWCAAVGCKAHHKDAMRAAILALLDAEAEAIDKLMIAHERYFSSKLIRERIAARKGGNDGR